MAIGSLSGAQAALASPRTPARVASAAHAGTTASIATHGATGAVRPAAARRPMAPGAGLRTEERQVSPSLGTGRRATETASAPTITSAASLAAPKNTSARALGNGACQIFSIPASATFTVGQPNSVNIYTGPSLERIGPIGFLPCTLSDGGATLPSGVTFTDSGYNGATLSGTPAAGTVGTYPFTITAANGGRSVSTLYYTLTVVQGCQITSSAGSTFTVGQAGTVTVMSTGSPTCTLSETGNLPTGVTFTDNKDGTATLAGTPAAGTAGTYPFTITAINGGTPDGTQSFTLTISQACQIAGSGAATFTVNQLATPVTVTSTGQPTCTLSETGTLPSGVKFTDNGNGTATLSGTPAKGTVGTYPVTITATNVLGYATQHFTLTVGQACAITSSTGATFEVNQAGTFTVTSTGPPTCALTAAGLPSGVGFKDNGDGTETISGTSTTIGTYPVTITATNGVSPAATQAFTLKVSAATACAITSSTDYATFTVGQPGTPVTVSSTGVPTCALSATGLPPGVTFTDNGDGTATLSGTPAPGTGGTHPITITATNGVLPAATQAFTLYVLQACQITIPAADTFTAGQAGTFTVTSTGTPTCALSETGTLPTGVTFTPNADGTATISGTPAAGTGGTYPITISATNGVLPVATQIFPLTVSQACQIISPAADTFTAGQAGTFTVTSTGTPTCALSATGLPAGVTFTDNGDGTASLSGTPAPGTGGTYLLTITATNGVGSDTQTFTLTVLQAPGITSAGHATCIVGQACAFTVKSTGVPTPGLSESGNLPLGVLFTDNGNGRAALSGIPAAGTGGTYRFRITATNIAGSDTQHFTLSVVGLPAAPSGLKATSRGRTVSLTWTNNASAPSAATAIEIQRATNARFTTALINTVVGPTVTSHKDTVVAGKRYYYRVRAHNAVGFSGFTNVVSP
ncbi:MAG: beta strand repeat-containing protein [Mycobacterium sp.]|uniref:beta strand repeat-containing protein n=1 Tax=Mycobacterium sp. TaxID=1785 RepID=UPI003F9B8F27